MKNIYKLLIGSTLLLVFDTTQAQTIQLNGGTLHIQSGGNIAADGNLVIDGTGTLTNNGLITVKGNFTNNLAMPSANTGTLTLNGTVQQTIDGSQPIFVKNIIFNNAAGFVLNNKLKADGIVDFTSGIINAPSTNNPLIFTSNASIGVLPGASKHVNGYVVREGNNAFTFPVGNGSVYQPVRTTTTANSNGIMAKYNTGDGGAGSTLSNLDSYNTAEYWDIAPYSGGTATGTVTIYWDGINDNSIIVTNDRKVAHVTGGFATNVGGLVTGGSTLAAGSTTSDAISTWSPFILGFKAAVPLPIQLVYFVGENKGDYNELSWETNTENRAKHFVLERSTNVNNFNNIGTIEAKNQQEKSIYNYPDMAPPLGINYYRLKMVDLDGTTKYSKTISLETKSDIATKIAYPNPTTNLLNVDYVNSKPVESLIQVYDNTGKIVYQNKIQSMAGKNSHEITVRNWANGVYLLKISEADKTFVRKIIKN